MLGTKKKASFVSHHGVKITLPVPALDCVDCLGKEGGVRELLWELQQLQRGRGGQGQKGEEESQEGSQEEGQKRGREGKKILDVCVDNYLYRHRVQVFHYLGLKKTTNFVIIMQL